MRSRAKELPRLAWAEDKTRVEEAVEAYLGRCRSGVYGKGGEWGVGKGTRMNVYEQS